MKANRHFEDDDLAFFAMRLLDEAETSAVAQQIAISPEDQTRLGEVQAHLGAYAEAMVPMQSVPDGGLERMMRRIAQEKVVPISRAMGVPVKSPPSVIPQVQRRRGVLPWIGWAAAAALAMTAGLFYEKQTGLHAALTAQTGQISQLNADNAAIFHERDALKTSLTDQARKLAELSGEAASARNDRENLRSTVVGQTARLKDQTAQVAHAEAERDRLQTAVTLQAGQVAQQESQVAQLTADAAQARQILEALSDRTALRVTLTKPKSRPAPTARVTYVASRGTFVFLANDLAPLKANKVYQLWLTPADGSKPIPEGNFVPDARGSASLVYARLPRPASAKGFSVTVENDGGSQTPTLPIILSGSAGL